MVEVAIPRGNAEAPNASTIKHPGGDEVVVFDGHLEVRSKRDGGGWERIAVYAPGFWRSAWVNESAEAPADTPAKRRGLID